VRERIKPFKEGYFISGYLGNRFSVPLYPWSDLEPFWPSISLAFTKVLIYNRFGSDATRDHHAWKDGTQGLEALKFLDLLSRDRGFSTAIRNFNMQRNMKYGGWLDPVYGQTWNWRLQMAQLGQFVHNIRLFLVETGYLELHKLDLGLEWLRPYWLPPRRSTLTKKWFEETFKFMTSYYNKTRRYPPLRAICEHWGITRRRLIDHNLIRPILIRLWQHYRRTGEITMPTPPKPTHRLLGSKNFRLK